MSCSLLQDPLSRKNGTTSPRAAIGRHVVRTLSCAGALWAGLACADAPTSPSAVNEAPRMVEATSQGGLVGAAADSLMMGLALKRALNGDASLLVELQALPKRGESSAAFTLKPSAMLVEGESPTSEPESSTAEIYSSGTIMDIGDGKITVLSTVTYRGDQASNSVTISATREDGSIAVAPFTTKSSGLGNYYPCFPSSWPVPCEVYEYRSTHVAAYSGTCGIIGKATSLHSAWRQIRTLPLGEWSHVFSTESKEKSLPSCAAPPPPPPSSDGGGTGDDASGGGGSGGTRLCTDYWEYDPSTGTYEFFGEACGNEPPPPGWGQNAANRIPGRTAALSPNVRASNAATFGASAAPAADNFVTLVLSEKRPVGARAAVYSQNGSMHGAYLVLSPEATMRDIAAVIEIVRNRWQRSGRVNTLLTPKRFEPEAGWMAEREAAMNGLLQQLGRAPTVSGTPFGAARALRIPASF